MNHPQSAVKACGVVHRLWASPDSRAWQEVWIADLRRHPGATRPTLHSRGGTEPIHPYRGHCGRCRIPRAAARGNLRSPGARSPRTRQGCEGDPVQGREVRRHHAGGLGS